jgi:uncharacterized protein (TIGR02145 family)
MRPIVGSVLLVLILLSTPIMLSDSGAAVKRDSVTSPGFHSMSSCCQGKRGNVNGLGTIDLGDLSALVSYLTGGGFVLSCPEAADVNGVGNIDLGDLSALVSYLTGSGYVPLNCLTVTDIDGNLYQTVTIGGRIWLAGNLKVTHYRNGDPISNVTDNGVWGNLTTGAYCAYGNDSTNIAPYGLLYNWYSVSDGRGLAPAGWHVATDTEWQQLELTLGMSQADVDAIASARGTTEGGKIKEAGTCIGPLPTPARTMKPVLPRFPAATGRKVATTLDSVTRGTSGPLRRGSTYMPGTDACLRRNQPSDVSIEVSI